MAAETPPSKHIKLAYTETFDVLVGSGTDQQRFTIYKDRLCSRSKFFRASQDEKWRTGKPVDLSNEEPEIFCGYLDCVYGQQLTLWALSCKTEENKYPALVKLWLLADKLRDVLSTNIVINEIIRRSDKVNDIPCPDVIKLVYKHSLPGCQLRRLLVNYYIHEAGSPYSAGHPEHLGNFFYEVAEEYRNAKQRSGDKKIDVAFKTWVSEREMCYYHQHDDKHPVCESTEKADLRSDDDDE